MIVLCGCSLEVKFLPSKQWSRVRFPSPALDFFQKSLINKTQSLNKTMIRSLLKPEFNNPVWDNMSSYLCGHIADQSPFGIMEE